MTTVFTTNNNNIDAGSGKITCGTLSCTTITSGSISPTGCVMAYLGTTDPIGWVIADGTARSDPSGIIYTTLVNMGVGTRSSGTYTPPNYKGAFLRGTGTNGTYSGPALNTSQNHATQTHTHTASSVVTDPGHTHTQNTINDDFNNTGSVTYPPGNPSFAKSDSAGSQTWTNINSHSTGVSVATTIANSTTFTDDNETRPYNFGVYWIIKY